MEQGYSICRQQFITHLIVDNNITISEADLAALLAVMSRLNEQFDGVKKCRQETSFLIKAYETYLEMDSFDREVAGLLKDKFDNGNNNSDDKTHDDIIEELSYEYSDKLSCYVSKAEIIRKSSFAWLLWKGGKVKCFQKSYMGKKAAALMMLPFLCQKGSVLKEGRNKLRLLLLPTGIVCYA